MGRREAGLPGTAKVSLVWQAELGPLEGLKPVTAAGKFMKSFSSQPTSLMAPITT